MHQKKTIFETVFFSRSRLKRSSYHLFCMLGLMMLATHLPAEATTALKDNTVVSTSSFSNFDGVNLTVDVPAYALQGQYRFLKIYDDTGQILFLGEVAATETFSIPVHKLKTATKLTIELFTESSLDQTVVMTYEIK